MKYSSGYFWFPESFGSQANTSCILQLQLSGENAYYYLHEYLLLKILLRYVLVKYANRGLIGKDGTVIKLFSKLYATCVVFMTATVFLSFFVKKIRNHYYDFQEKSLINVNLKYFHSINIVGLAHFLLTLVLGLIQFYGVKYVMLEKKYLITRKYQSNIITFNNNFFFFSLFEILEIMKSLALFINRKYFSSHTTVIFLAYYQLFRVFLFGFIRPIIILLLLKRNMPDFFTEETQELQNENKHFYIIANDSPTPRQQSFSQYKPFIQNARWGWQRRRFRQDNEEISQDYRVGGKPLGSTQKLMPNVEI